MMTEEKWKLCVKNAELFDLVAEEYDLRLFAINWGRGFCCLSKHYASYNVNPYQLGYFYRYLMFTRNLTSKKAVEFAPFDIVDSIYIERLVGYDWEIWVEEIHSASKS